MNDISSSFASTTIAATPSVVCSSSSSAQLFYAFPAINIFPFWIRFFQVFHFILAHIILLYLSLMYFSACANGGTSVMVLDGRKQGISSTRANMSHASFSLLPIHYKKLTRGRLCPLFPLFKDFGLPLPLLKLCQSFFLCSFFCLHVVLIERSPPFRLYHVGHFLTVLYSGIARGGISDVIGVCCSQGSCSAPT